MSGPAIARENGYYFQTPNGVQMWGRSMNAIQTACREAIVGGTTTDGGSSSTTTAPPVKAGTNARKRKPMSQAHRANLSKAIRAAKERERQAKVKVPA